jgi:transglutaminase-like putative cysteine protease
MSRRESDTSMGDELNKVDDLDQFRAAAAFIDSESPGVSAFAKRAAAGADAPIDAALRLYAAVRDDIIYDPYVDFSDPSNYRASGVLAAGRGFCIGKAALFAASARSVGIPARVGYADVRNHLTSPRLRQLIGTDIFVWHSYTDIFLAGRWVKATPAFDRALCDRVGIKTLDFDGRSDSLFHPFDRSGRRHMEYLADRGTFPDVPLEAILADFRDRYPALLRNHGVRGDFRSEAVAAAVDE